MNKFKQIKNNFRSGVVDHYNLVNVEVCQKCIKCGWLIESKTKAYKRAGTKSVYMHVKCENQE
jgi:hypothetical protein